MSTATKKKRNRAAKTTIPKFNMKRGKKSEPTYDPSDVENDDVTVADMVEKKGKSKRAKKEKPAPEPKEKKVSQLDAAYDVLKASGEPMACMAICNAMVEAKTWVSPGGKTPDRTLYSALMREINTKGDESRFIKSDKGKFEARK